MGAFLFLSFPFPATPASAESDEVRYVIDGDTVVMSNGRHARLIGINAPELGKDGAPDQPLAREARARLALLVEKRRVTLSFEREHEDHYGRLLAHVVLPDGRDVEEILLREGLAWAVAIPPNVDRLNTMLKAENEARAVGRGVWGESAYRPKPAGSLTSLDTGFLFIEGTVRRRAQGREVIYFDLTPRVALVVPREDWKKYFNGQSDNWVGRHVIARGWLTEKRDRGSDTGTYRLQSQKRNVAVAEQRTRSKGRLHLRVPHPAMLTWRD